MRACIVLALLLTCAAPALAGKTKVVAQGPFVMIIEDDGIDETYTAIKRKLVTSVRLARRGRFYLTITTEELDKVLTGNAKVPTTDAVHRDYTFEFDQEKEAVAVLDRLLAILSEEKPAE